jgi:metal-sulfur cluster biosynthetic enzyme
MPRLRGAFWERCGLRLPPLVTGTSVWLWRPWFGRVPGAHLLSVFVASARRRRDCSLPSPPSPAPSQTTRNDFLEAKTNGLVPSYIDSEEVFEHIRHINDPEHPLTLEQLKVVQLSHVSVDPEGPRVAIQFTPTIPHCSMATLIGLCIRVKLIRSLPARFKMHVSVFPGSHASEDSINKQLNDKERVAAALENPHLLDVVNKCIAHTERLDLSEFSIDAF